MIILVIAVGTVIDADARMRSRVNVEDFGVLEPAHLDLADAVQRHILEPNDFVQLRVVFGQQIILGREQQDCVHFRFAAIAGAAEFKCFLIEFFFWVVILMSFDG